MLTGKGQTMKKIYKGILFAFLFVTLLLASNQLIKAKTTQTIGMVSTNGSNLNIRSTSSTSAKVIGSLPNKSYITLIDNQGDWWEVLFDENKSGFISAQYINQISFEERKVKTNGGSLNIRKGKSTSTEIIGKLSNKTSVLVIDVKSDWSKIIFHGNKVGYVSSSYLENKTSSSAISLDTFDYKQYDVRWKNLTLGNTKYTMQQIGCVTTALAITEAYRINPSITPITMLNQLRYTSGGAAYWPSQYKAYTGKDYLQKIYKNLQNNKPVLLGSKTSAAKQHWVVITGFKGGNMVPNQFEIRDPGFSTKTTLDQHIKDYPNFYKLMLY